MANSLISSLASWRTLAHGHDPYLHLICFMVSVKYLSASCEQESSNNGLREHTSWSMILDDFTTLDSSAYTCVSAYTPAADTREDVINADDTAPGASNLTAELVRMEAAEDFERKLFRE